MTVRYIDHTIHASVGAEHDCKVVFRLDVVTGAVELVGFTRGIAATGEQMEAFGKMATRFIDGWATGKIEQLRATEPFAHVRSFP